MFGIGMPEIIVILVVALIFIGPGKLPEIARALGKGYGEFSRSMRDVRREMEEMADDEPAGLLSPDEKSPRTEDDTPGG